MAEPERDIVWSDCLAAAATLLSQNPALVGKWGQPNWPTTMSDELLQLANRIYERA